MTTADHGNAGTPGHWLAHAESDLRIARLVRNDPEVLPNQIAFHAQQAAEKALKSVLVCCEVDFPRTHHLEELIDLLRESGVKWPFAADEVESLTPYAAQTRYPGDVFQIGKADVDRAITLAERVVAWAKREIEKRA